MQARGGPGSLFWKAFLLITASSCKGPEQVAEGEHALRRESVTLSGGGPDCTVHLLYSSAPELKRPVILMLGSLSKEEPPPWSVNLLREGFLLAAFSVAHPPDPDPDRQPVWLHFDERFAHSYALSGLRAPGDAGRVIDYLASRADVDAERIGWLGSSSTGIPGLAVAVREKRVKAVVAFVSTGAYREWLASWKTNGLWKGKTDSIWPETDELLRKVDPILETSKLYPAAILLVSGGMDRVVDPATARSFVNAARPYYERDPERLRLVVYEGFGHNLPVDVVQLHAEHWFRRYLGAAARPEPTAQRALRSAADTAPR